ncbi:hypothetical protein PAXINDRAFT_11283 [Paxillus involutus ATCC 200175]|nr:hypothetical protein PAXINDRAFT_11283 [Paxillus involutus ATCC 200175]
MSTSPVDPSAVGTNTQPERKGPSTGDSCADDPDLPPQRHAGAVGLGPNYVSGVGFGEKVAGLKDEIKGKILREPEVTERGRERRTGELKKKEKERDNMFDPFAAPEDNGT